ncbi:MAG TPA: EAL domain-containing protein [Verrucomicrobiae bacterium]|nr:EAL domain-containing protein [Verrucomicrobiae bacterium]
MSDDKYRRVLAEGEWLFREGDEGETAFVIENGLLEICRVEDGRTERIAQLGPGDLIGEMSLIDKMPRSASAFARLPTRLRVITGDHLAEKLSDADPLLRLLLKMILQRYRTATGGEAESPSEQKTDREAVIKRIELEHELEQALEREEFVLYFQPIVNLDTFSMAGFEALVRWVSPARGFVPPNGFIPVVEDSHLIHGVGRWILRKGCEVLKRLSEVATDLDEPIFMNINLSGKQLANPDLFNEIKDAIDSSGVNPAQLKMEITESLLMNNLDSATELLNRCRDLGVRIALDDFGTGYSSLGYLRSLPVNTLKVDRSFVTPVLEDAGSGKILRAISALGHSLGMNLVAEGIENQEQAHALSALGFEYGQGFLFSKAVPEEQAKALLSREWPWSFERRQRVDRRA